MRSRYKLNKPAIIIMSLTMLLVSGCTEYTSRRESLSPGLGNAMAANTALQTVDPWPIYVEDRHIHTDGTKASNAIESYRTPPATESEGGGASLVLQPAPTASP